MSDFLFYAHAGPELNAFHWQVGGIEDATGLHETYVQSIAADADVMFAQFA